MSKQIDERVVEMEFDNRDFEKNVQTSLNTIDKLKQKLKFTESAKELNSLDKAVNSTTFEKAANSAKTLAYKISAFTVARNAVITNVVNHAIESARKLEAVVKDSIVGGGMRRAQNIENAHFMLQGLLKDEKKVQAVMDDAMYSVDGTAYAYDEAAKAASQFAASGIQAGDDMKQALRGITGVAAMTNSSYEDIARVFTTVAGNGRLMGDQLLQLSSRGMNVAATLGEYFGKSEEEIRDMVKHGEISFEMFSEAMDKTFGDHAKKANETFTGAMANVKSALARIGAKFFSPLIVQNGTLVKMFNTLRERINDINKEVDPLANVFVSAVEKVAKTIDDTIGNDEAFSHIVDGVKNIAKLIAQVAGIAKDAFGDIFPPKTQEDITNAAKGFSKMTESLKLTDEQAEKVKSAFKGLFAVFDIGSYLLKSGFNFFKDTFGIFSGLIIDTNASLGDMIVSFRDWLKEDDRVGKALKKVSDIIKKVKDDIKGLVDGTKSYKDVFSNIFDNVSKRFTNFSKTVQKLLPSIDFNKILSGALLIELIKNSKKLGNVFTSIAKPFLSFEKTFKGFGTSFTKVGTSITKAFGATTTEIKSEAMFNVAKSIAAIAGSLYLLSKVNSDQLLDAAKSLSMVIGVIGGLILVFKALDEFGSVGNKIQNIDRPVTAIDKLVGGLRGIMTAAKQYVQSEAIKNLAEAVAVIAGAIGLLANFDPANLMGASAAISILAATMTGMMAAISVISKGEGSLLKASAGMAIMLVVIGSLSYILAKVAELPIQNTIGAAASLSVLMGTLTGCMAVFAVLGADSAIVGHVALASAAFDAMLAIVGGMALGLGALFEHFDGLEGKLDKGIEISGKIGTFIGTFAGNIVGSFAEGAMSHLPEMGNYLSEFITNIQPFFDAINNLNPSSASAIKDLGIALGFIAGADFLSNMQKIFTGGFFGTSSFDGESFKAMGKALKDFGDSTKDITDAQLESIKKAAQALKAMAEFANEIPNEGGFISKIVGDNKLGEFGPQMATFGTSLKTFGESVDGLKIDAINAAMEPARSMIEIAEMIPNSGGLIAEIAGDNNLTMFGVQLATFGNSLVNFSQTLVGLKAGTISNAKQPMQDMVEIAQMVPMLTEGTAAGFFGGDNSLSKMGAEFILFADKLKTYSEKMTGVNTSAITTTAPALKTIMELVSSIPSKKDFKHLKKFGKQLVEFAGEMKEFSNKFDVDISKVITAKTVITELKEIFTSMDGVNTSAGKDFTSFLKSISHTSLSKFASDISKEKPKVEKSGSELIDSLIKGISSKKSNITKAFNESLSSANSAIRSYYSQFLISGGYLIDGFANGIRSKKYKAIEEAKNTAKEALEEFNKALDERSPSKETYKSGGFFVQGYVNALGAGKSKTKKISAELASVSIEGFKDVLKSFDVGDLIRLNGDFSIASAISKASKSMLYGKSVLVEYYNAFIKVKEGSINVKKSIKDASKAITEYGKKLYKESQYYEQDTQNLKDHKKELKNLNKIRKQYQSDLKKAQNGTLKNSKKSVKQIKSDIKEINKAIKEANKQIELDEKDIADHTAEVFNELRGSLVDSFKSIADPFTQGLDIGIDLFSRYDTNETLYAKDLENLKATQSEYDSLVKKREEIQNEILKMEKINTTASRINGKNLEKELSEVEKAIEKAESNIKSIEESMEEHSSITVQSILDNMQSQVDGITDWQNKLQTLANRKVPLAEGLLNQLKEMGPEGANYVDQFVKMTDDEITKANELFNKSSSMTSQTLLDNFQASLDKASKMSEGYAELARRGFSEEVIKQLSNMGGEAAQYIDALLSMTPEQQAQFQQKYASFLAIPESAADTIMASYVKAGNNIVKSTASILDIVTGQVSASKKSATELVSSLGLDTMDSLTSAFDSKKKKVKSSAGSVGKAAAKEMSKKLSKKKGKTIASNFSEGLVNGLEASSNTVSTAALGLANLIPTTIASALQIHSPSRVAIGLMKFFDDGLIKGLNDNADGVRDSVVETMSDVISSAYDSLDSDMNYDPTVTPVIDLSEIQNGTNNLKSMFNGISGTVSINNDLANSIRTIQNDNNALWGAVNDLKDTIKQMNNESGDTIFNNDFKIENPDPKAVANEVSNILQRQVDRRSREWA